MATRAKGLARRDGPATRSPRFWAVTALALLLVMSASAFVVSRGVALALSRESPAAALVWWSSEPEALLRVNDVERDAGAKMARARAVLVQRPADGRAYRQLAEVHAEKGQLSQARALYGIAVRHAPRDRVAQAWLADDALATGQVSDAAERVWGLAHLDGELRPLLLAYMWRLATNAQLRPILAARFSGTVEWRHQFLAKWHLAGVSFDVYDSFMQALVAAGADLSLHERREWVDALMARRSWKAAYAAWASGVEAELLPHVPAVFNGGFEQEATGGFDWTIEPTPGSAVSLAATDGIVGKQALRVEFYGERVDFSQVHQWLLLAPGRYTLRMSYRLDSLQSQRGLVWRLRCIEPVRMLAETRVLNGTTQWSVAAEEFTVPEACSMQEIRLEHAARTPAERRVRGIAWFDEIALAPSPCGFDPSACDLTQTPSPRPLREPPRPVVDARPLAASTSPTSGPSPLPKPEAMSIVSAMLESRLPSDRYPDVPVGP